MNKRTSTTTARVYYEDTDAGGIVYYANYLKFAERARTEMLRERGIAQSELLAKEHLAFVVRHVEMDLAKPAKLDDLLEIDTEVTRISGASLIMVQHIRRKTTVLAEIKVTIATIHTHTMRPVRIPAFLKEAFK